MTYHASEEKLQGQCFDRENNYQLNKGSIIVKEDSAEGSLKLSRNDVVKQQSGVTVRKVPQRHDKSLQL
jgi:hypothetical protein